MPDSRDLLRSLGVEATPVSHAERLLSGLGGFIGILGVALLTRMSVDWLGTGLMLASMGATAVLLFAVPHSPLSRPWPVLGGHLISALVGVGCARAVPDEALAAALAVGVAITVMYYLRCLHPPGGATALAAVVGGEATRALGYQYVLTPVMLDVLVILTLALAFNAFFPWRRHPSLRPGRSAPSEQVPAISHEDFVFALSQIDSYVDISEEDLVRIYELATGRATGAPPPGQPVR